MAYEWIGAAAAAAAQLGSGIAMATKKRGSTRMMNVSKELARYNTQLSEEMYNKYESPAAQMAQYKEAGLNPNLIYGQQLNGPSAGQVDTNPANYEPESKAAYVLQGLSNAITTYQQIRSNQIANQNAEIVGQLNGLKAANEEKKGTAMDIQNKILADTADYQVESMALKVGSQQFAHAYNWKVKMQQGLNDLEKQKEELVGLRHKNKKVLKEIDAIDVSMDMMRKQMEVADKQMDQITQNMDIQAERRPWELKSIQTGIGYQRQMAGNEALKGQRYQKDLDYYSTDKYVDALSKIYSGSIPNAILKTLKFNPNDIETWYKK